VSKPRIVIADDHPKVLNRIAEFLADEFEIVALVPDGAAAVKAVLAAQPDILILDIAMPEMDGIEAAKRLRDLRSSVKIIFLTAAADREPQFDSWQKLGAQGYVLKARMRSDLVLAIRTVLEGGTFFLPDGHSPRTE
jgi:DNA-binding NarL/FixJ family response regulator